MPGTQREWERWYTSDSWVGGLRTLSGSFSEAQGRVQWAKTFRVSLISHIWPWKTPALPQLSRQWGCWQGPALGALKVTVNCPDAETGELLPGVVGSGPLAAWPAGPAFSHTECILSCWFQGGRRPGPQGGSDLAVVSFRFPSCLSAGAPSIFPGTPLISSYTGKTEDLKAVLAWVSSCEHEGAPHPDGTARRKEERER